MRGGPPGSSTLTIPSVAGFLLPVKRNPDSQLHNPHDRPDREKPPPVCNFFFPDGSSHPNRRRGRGENRPPAVRAADSQPGAGLQGFPRPAGGRPTPAPEGKPFPRAIGTPTAVQLVPATSSRRRTKDRPQEAGSYPTNFPRRPGNAPGTDLPPLLSVPTIHPRPAARRASRPVSFWGRGGFSRRPAGAASRGRERPTRPCFPLC